jgi:hypothetical protein
MVNSRISTCSTRLSQDNNFYNHNPLYGINDRHAVVPKRWFKAYFNRYEVPEMKS